MRLSIRHKIGFWLFIGVFLFTFSSLLFQQYSSYKQFTEHVQYDAEISVKLAIDQTNKWLMDKKVLVRMLALETENRMAVTTDVGKEFQNLLKDFGIKSGYLGLEKEDLFSTNKEGLPEDYKYKDKAWYKKAKRDRRISILRPRIDEATGKYKITFSSPLFDEYHLMMKGVAGLDVYLEDLQPVIESVFISNRDRIEFMPIENGFIGIFVKEKDVSEEDFDKLIKSFQNLHPRNKSVMSMDDGKYLIVYQDLSISNLRIIYPISLTNLMQPLIIQIVIIFVVCTLILVALFQFSTFVIGKYLQPIEELNQKTKNIAAGDFKSKIKIKSKDEIGELAESFNKMTDSLITHMNALKESVRYQERINREMELAAELQRKALPEVIPVVPGIEIAAKSIPANIVGGDYFDFLHMDLENTGFAIGDAAGKGLPGTILMTNLRSIFRVTSSAEKNPGSLLKKMNDFICGDSSSTSGVFMTFVYGIYDAVNMRFTYSNAGHYAPLVFKKSDKSFISDGDSNMPLGIQQNLEYPAETVQLAPGDILVLYTDGIIEAKNKKKELFGLENIKEILRKNFQQPAQKIFNKVDEDIKLFVEDEPQFDDMTLIIIKINTPMSRVS